MSRLDDLRESFDETFARALPAAPPELEALLLVRSGGEPLALRMSEVGGVESGRREIVALPGAAPALVGLAGLRGRLVPVFSLAGLLKGTAREEVAPWLVLSRGEEPVAFCVEAIEGHALVARSELSGGAVARTPEPRGVIALGEVLRALGEV